MKDFDYDWQVLEAISNAFVGVGARVQYTPLDQKLTTTEVFVLVRWDHATDLVNARELLETEIIAQTPTERWSGEFGLAAEDITETITTEFNMTPPSGSVVK